MGVTGKERLDTRLRERISEEPPRRILAGSWFRSFPRLRGRRPHADDTVTGVSTCRTDRDVTKSR